MEAELIRPFYGASMKISFYGVIMKKIDETISVIESGIAEKNQCKRKWD